MSNVAKFTTTYAVAFLFVVFVVVLAAVVLNGGTVLSYEYSSTETVEIQTLAHVTHP